VADIGHEDVSSHGSSRSRLSGCRNAGRRAKSDAGRRLAARERSTDKRTKIIVFMVADQKNPSTVAE
jgi:hypothetical protein